MFKRSRTLFILTSLLFLFLIFLSSCNDASVNEQDDIISEDIQLPSEDSENASEGNILGAKNEEIIPEPVIVGIYGGKGHWDINLEAIINFLDNYEIEWSVFDEIDAVEADLSERYDLIWFPGGFAAEYKNYIRDHANIRSFVEEGGMFIGSCAGAYYAGDILRWQGTDHEYPLKLFNGKGVGPLSGLIGWGEIDSFSLETEHSVNLEFDTTIEFYYFDGPYFEPYVTESIVILSRYEVNAEPAVIAGHFGDGKYLLLGPHPELGGYSPSSPNFNVSGGEGAQWPWLYSAISWLITW
ncbi:MAG: BPL-N domain-containing protein [Bacillota bacterium]|nr:BPL-N domain-containing protein [Bacillota bacterium]